MNIQSRWDCNPHNPDTETALLLAFDNTFKTNGEEQTTPEENTVVFFLTSKKSGTSIAMILEAFRVLFLKPC